MIFVPIKAPKAKDNAKIHPDRDKEGIAEKKAPIVQPNANPEE